jgi:hypothetical protein
VRRDLFCSKLGIIGKRNLRLKFFGMAALAVCYFRNPDSYFVANKMKDSYEVALAASL